jgi:hypothetical protein
MSAGVGLQYFTVHYYTYICLTSHETICRFWDYSQNQTGSLQASSHCCTTYVIFLELSCVFASRLDASRCYVNGERGLDTWTMMGAHTLADGPSVPVSVKVSCLACMPIFHDVYQFHVWRIVFEETDEIEVWMSRELGRIFDRYRQ